MTRLVNSDWATIQATQAGARDSSSANKSLHRAFAGKVTSFQECVAIVGILSGEVAEKKVRPHMQAPPDHVGTGVAR
jgi:hypothetical protein